MTRGLRQVIGRLQFQPALLPSLGAIALIALTISLGNWQSRRAEEKIAAARSIDEAASRAVLAISAAPLEARIEHSRVSARGQFLPERTLFLDNKTLRGIAGYHVLTPLRIEGGDLAVLVDRGWIAAGDRRTLPNVATPAGTQTIEGVASVPSRRFVELAPDTAAGPLKQNLVLEQAEKQLALRLQPFVIQQTSDTPDGLQRVRARPDTGVDRHRSYALQWYSLALLTVILYVVLNLKQIEAGHF